MILSGSYAYLYLSSKNDNKLGLGINSGISWGSMVLVAPVINLTQDAWLSMIGDGSEDTPYQLP